ncbi:MAG TPA: pyridoxamine 5'-phosphate oxidase family protein [Acidobacteriota bacterium]|nr:pyridoxamine 5'-phosphate oxidase family protein [Acidobacteriota bacterium]
MSGSDAKQDCLKLMEATDIMYLSTIGEDGFPYIRGVMNLRNSKNYPDLVEIFNRHGNDFQVYISTRTSSNKIKQIAADNAVSIYYCDPEKHQGLMLAGQAEIVSDSKMKHRLWQDDWGTCFPDGKNDLDYSIIRIRPAFAQGWWESATFRFELAGRI